MFDRRTYQRKYKAEQRTIGVVERKVIREVIDQVLNPPRPIPKSDKLRISRAKWVYTLKEVTMKQMVRRRQSIVCYYHQGKDDKEIKVGDVIFSASKTRTRSFPIIAHLDCAMRMGLVIPSEVEGKFTFSVQ